MFETLDTMISLGVVFLILSMVHKYLMSVVKRFFNIKAKVVAEEMKTFIGVNTAEYLIPYLEKKAKHLNFLECIKGENVLRQLNKEQLKEVVGKLEVFFKNNKDIKTINKELGLEISEHDFEEKIGEIKEHIGTLKVRIENMYDNTTEKISELYNTRLRWRTLICGLILAFIINADFFEIYNSLAENSVVREKLIAKADVINMQMAMVSRQIDQRAGEEVAIIGATIKEVRMDVDNLTKNLEEAGFLLGWEWKKIQNIYVLPNEDADKCFLIPLNIFLKLIGICVSGLLISFGAPFWHNFIGSFTGIRKNLLGKKGGYGGATMPQTDRKDEK